MQTELCAVRSLAVYFLARQTYYELPKPITADSLFEFAMDKGMEIYFITDFPPDISGKDVYKDGKHTLYMNSNLNENDGIKTLLNFLGNYYLEIGLDNEVHKQEREFFADCILLMAGIEKMLSNTA